MTKREAYEIVQTEHRLRELGISHDDTQTLRRISLTLRRWFELECGTGHGQTTISIERDGDDGDGKPFRRVQFPTAHGYVDQRYPIADRERGALRRLHALMHQYPALTYYVQSDPRGCALYILTADQLTGGEIHRLYTRGVAIG